MTPSLRSLTDSLDQVNSAVFYDQEIETAERLELARWLGGRQGLAGPYSATFAPTFSDREQSGATWTGEPLSDSAQRHCWTMETCRALTLLDSHEEEPRASLRKVMGHMRRQLRRAPSPGFFRSGPVSVALWRLATVGGIDRGQERLDDALRQLRWHRRDDGQWRGFPFHYSLSALLEMDVDRVQGALEHAAPACERSLKVHTGDSEIDERRQEIVERVLARV